MKRFCQTCAKEIRIEATRCPYCGTIQSTSGISIRKKESGTSVKRILMILLIGAIGGGAVIALYWNLKVKPRLQGLGVMAPDTKKIRKTLEIENDTSPNFDKKVSLPVEPMGFTFGRAEYVLGSRRDPWGLVRMTPVDDATGFDLTTVPVHEPRYSQQMSFNTVAWNGIHYVSVTDGAWFQSPSKNVFCKHDPVSFKIVSTTPAPDQLGCLAYDGQSYWGATRSNTKTSGEPVFLYQFDADLREVSRHAARAKGCQGLTWDGQYLWMADVFNDSIYVLDIAGEEPALVQTIQTDFSYLSGIAFDGRDIWVSEYDNDQIHRLDPAVRRSIGAASSSPATTTPGMIVSNPSERKFEDSYINDSPEYPDEDADIHEFSAQIENGTIYASWKIHFGDRLFDSSAEPSADNGFSMPLFARYIVTVTAPSLSQPVQETYEARPGMNEKSMAPLMQITESGAYDISLFIHVQYIRPDGGNQILNKNAMPLRLNYN